MSRANQVALILSDWQCDLHDQSFIDRTVRLARDLQPDRIVHVGDESDATTIGRWVQGTPAEAEGNLQVQIDVTHDNLAAVRRAAPNAEIDVCYSNHLGRFASAVTTRIPAFRHLRGLRIEELFGLDDLKINYRRELFEVFPGVLAAHGHQFGLTSANQALKGPQWCHKLGASIVAGHTHRPLLTSAAQGAVGAMTSRFYLNVGCSMDFGKAEYITSRSPEWGLGVGVLEYNPRMGVHPTLIAANSGGRFRFGGKWY